MRLLTFLVLSFLTQTALGKITDRLLLEVNRTTYTQRQMEVYLSLRSALYTPLQDQLKLVNQKNWSESLDLFQRDMIVDQQASRLTSLQLSESVLQELIESVKIRQRQDIIFDGIIQFYAIDEFEMRTVLLTIARVTRYANSRKGNLRGVTYNDLKEVRFSDDSWYKKLLDNSIVRVLDGGSQYRALVPFKVVKLDPFNQ